MSVPSHPLKPFALAIGLNRLCEARSFNIKPFSERAKAVLNDAHLSNINIKENNILAFPPWDIQIFNYSNPFSWYDKAGTANVIYQQLFSFHRRQETWDQQNLNKLHSIHPSTFHWAALPVRRHDVRLTRLRIGHTRFMHRHILLGENAA
ncbi:putative RNA-directed DNA polymerase from transposon X-element [Trichonephila clavipes]|uniref:Putative RNA-directed DNA polymerase from transposon X-element n=1 Tax=Trichonephila clavipes TaxID=2585209 RepID=A0A8X6SD99_TRICX|nr:putative RNA-directed DNA polymerase from transposon X-element [Trichonephila clavipes]